MLACALAWIIASPLWISGQGLDHPNKGPLLQVMMFAPTVAALVVLWRAGYRRGILRATGVTPLRPLRPLLRYCLAGLALASLVMGGGILLAALAGGYQPDLTDFSGFRELTAPMGLTTTDGQGVPLAALGGFAVLQVLGLVLSVPATLGEELGWRGYLLPALMPLGTWPALLVHGVVWGVWHAPVILLGYNFARPDLAGVGLMTAWCVLFGVLLAWLRLASGSVWPAVMGHVALNSATAWVMVFGDADSMIGGSDALPPGVWVGTGLMMAVLVATGALVPRVRASLRLPSGSGHA